MSVRSSRVAGPVGPGWFAVAVQALVMLASSDRVCPSATIAGQVNSHAVFLRRVLAQLVRANIVEAREGRDGGYQLARPADQITLAEVFRAVKASGALAPLPEPPAELACATGWTGMQAAMGEIVEETEARIIEVLGRHT